MKVFELLRSDIKVVSEEQIVERMKRFDWKYEFAEDISRIAWGNRELEIIENMIYQMWKASPDKAVALWNEHGQGTPADKTVVPSFIFRLEAQENETTRTPKSVQ